MTVGQLYRKLQHKVQKIVRNGCATPFFRGQSNSSWNLTPGLGREVTYDPNVEREMYTEFRKRGAHLISDAKTDWDILYLMQHHGVPTRLLDWSESFANALYFALPEEVSIDETRTGRLFILDTSHLNYAETATNSIVTLNAKFPAGYEHYFLNESHDEVYPGFPRAVAVGGLSTSSRIYAQRVVFTIHGDPLAHLKISALRRFSTSTFLPMLPRFAASTCSCGYLALTGSRYIRTLTH